MTNPEYVETVTEIHALRRALAYEAAVMKEHLGYATIPVGVVLAGVQLGKRINAVVTQPARLSFESDAERSGPLTYADQAALEVADLRNAFTGSADVIETMLTFRSFPKSRRSIAIDQITRLRTAASSDIKVLYAGEPHRHLDGAYGRAGGIHHFNTEHWEAEVDALMVVR